MKTCNKCGVEKAFSEYNKNNSYSDGYDKTCRTCRKQRSRDLAYEREMEYAAGLYRRTMQLYPSSDNISLFHRNSVKGINNRFGGHLSDDAWSLGVVEVRHEDDDMFGENGFYPGRSWEEIC